MSLAFSAAASYKRKMLLPAAVGAGLMVFGFLLNRPQFFQSYLQGYLFAVAIPLGCLGVTMIHNLSGGNWGWTIRPFLEAGIKTLPAMALLFIPVALGVTSIFPWTNHELVAHDPVLLGKEAYLNVPFWLGRAAFYFALWSILSLWLLRWLLPSPTAGTLSQQHRVQRLSAGGLLLFVLSTSFAAIDWAMSIEPHWFSSIFGVIVIVGYVISAFSVATMSLILFNNTTPNPWLTSKNLHDLSKFMFMGIMLWGYMSLSQFLIIWSGNLPEETFWYYERSLGGWWWLSLFMPILQWVLPFCLLLSAKMKKKAPYVFKVGAFLLVVRALEQVWFISPSLRLGAAFPFHWMDLVAPVTLGALWAALYFSFLGGSSGVPAPAGHAHTAHEPQDQPGGKH
ncbi:hypothetical protein K2X33_00800 [bacterium]|nr:hypothetical protein [bacterium]